MTGAVWAAGAVALALTAGAATAQQVNCVAPQTQFEMNECAAQRYRQADDTLNAIWPDTKARMDGIGLGADLLDAQRKWLAFRDAACAVERGMFQGGSIAPMVHYNCLTRLTLARNADLNALRF